MKVYANRFQNVPRTIGDMPRTSKQCPFLNVLQTYKKSLLLNTMKQNKNNNLCIIQRNKDEHAIGDLHYGISNPRYAGYNAMPGEGGHPKPARHVGNPVSVDNLNAVTNITRTFARGDRDYMCGYFDVINMLNIHVIGPGATKDQRWLNFLKNNLAYLSIEKEIMQIQSVNATTVAPTKDRLNKNGGLDAGHTSDRKKEAIVAAYNLHYFDPVYTGYEGEVSDWIWDVFFRKTSKLGIKFTVEENKVIHFNVYAPPYNRSGDSEVHIDATHATHARQPITHSEMRYINRTYGANHAHIDPYYYKNTNIDRLRSPGEMNTYIQARSYRISNDFFNMVLVKANLPGWETRRNPTGIGLIKNEINLSTPVNYDNKLKAIRDIAIHRIGFKFGRHRDTKQFYLLLVNSIPQEIDDYRKPGTSIMDKNLIINKLKENKNNIEQFNFT